MKCAGPINLTWLAFRPHHAVCMYQGDVEERNHQVQLMAQIYKTAQVVVVWLGEASEDSDHAMDAAEKWGMEHLDKDSRYLVWRHRSGDFDERSWTALRKLLGRPYWTRAWVYSTRRLCLGRRSS